MNNSYPTHSSADDFIIITIIIIIIIDCDSGSRSSSSNNSSCSNLFNFLKTNFRESVFLPIMHDKTTNMKLY